MERLVDVICALGLATLAGLKIVGGVPPDVDRTLAHAATAWECALAIAFATGRLPRGSAWGLAAFGVVISTWTLLLEPTGFACACLGPLRAPRPWRGTIGAVCLLVAGARLAMRPRRGDAGRGHASQPPSP